MNDQRTTTAVGLALVAAGVVVAVLGYLGVSQETEVAFQLPYLASAGIGALMLLGAGSAMLVSGRLSRDTSRLDDLEEAVRTLCVEVGRMADELGPAKVRPANVVPANVGPANVVPAPAVTAANGAVEHA